MAEHVYLSFFPELVWWLIIGCHSTHFCPRIGGRGEGGEGILAMSADGLIAGVIQYFS